MTSAPRCSIRRTGASPVGPTGRTAKARAKGAALALTISMTNEPPAGPGTAPTRWIASPPGIRMSVSTTGVPSTNRWRTETSRAGRCHRSSAPIHQSNDHPPGTGVISPRPSTIACPGLSTVPSVVHDRPVTFLASAWATNAGERTSSWRSSQ